MRSTLFLGAVAMMIASTLVHCASNNESPTPDGGATSDEAATPEAAVDVDADASDAATEDEFEIPDGAVVCETSPCAIAVVGARSSSTLGRFCAVLEDKTVQCWGSNMKNGLGYETDASTSGLPSSPAPRPIPGLTGVTNLSLGPENSCARVEGGGVYCWGDPALVSAGIDRDGRPPLESPALPTRQDLVPTSASSVAVGNGTACVTVEGGGLTCWGRNDNLQLAQRTTEPFGPPTSIPGGGRTFSAVWPGAGPAGWSFASTTSGELLSWGPSRCSTSEHPCPFILGRDTSEDPDPVPGIVPDLAHVRGMATSGQYHVCAIVGREVQCWGDNSRGELGRGSITSRSELPGPTTLAAAAAADDVDAGVASRVDVPLQIVGDAVGSTYVVMGSGRVFGWGQGPRSQKKPLFEWGRPTRIDAPSGVVALAVTNDAFCALLRSGVVECWGANILGALGRGIDTTFTDPKPAPVVFSH